MAQRTKEAQHLSINRLPSELLVSIFQIVVDSAYPRNIGESMSYTYPASKLAQVCSYWHQVLLEAGSLWSCVVFPYQVDGNYEHVSTVIRMQLERTRGSLLDLFLFDNQPYYTFDKSELQPTCDLIGPYIKQLRSLTIHAHRSEDIETLLECCLVNGTVGSLSRLGIIGDISEPPLFSQADLHTHERLNEYLRSVRILKLDDATFGWQCAIFEEFGELALNGYLMKHPEGDKVKGWMHTLRRAFLTETAPTPERMADLDDLFTTIEQYDKMTIDCLIYSGIERVMRRIIQLTIVPSNAQYRFRQRARALVEQWQPPVGAHEDYVFLPPVGLKLDLMPERKAGVGEEPQPQTKKAKPPYTPPHFSALGKPGASGVLLSNAHTLTPLARDSIPPASGASMTFKQA
ncbi:hypothetical protein BDV93DRAFT_608971 [Ceratobasidium sp. AG-I]|nr:hypothetical protein BDV93DRAFT_608971 [Ceratobasidium sp. AG-I]